jgi:hypothetical protein
MVVDEDEHDYSANNTVLFTRTVFLQLQVPGIIVEENSRQPPDGSRQRKVSQDIAPMPLKMADNLLA